MTELAHVVFYVRSLESSVAFYRDAVGLEVTVFPHPVQAVATIKYDLPNTALVALSVVDVLGRQVKELVTGVHPPATYEVSFDASELPSGVYLYRLQAGHYVETRRVVVTR